VPEASQITVAVGMSGGMDSSVAALRLVRQGYRVIGLTMQTWDGSIPLSGGHPGCYGPGEADDLASARRQAERLGIPHHVVPLADEFKAEVLAYVRREYGAGRTPNPCVRCNRRVKFGALLDRARALGVAFERFATGHYARVVPAPLPGRCRLLRGSDPAKDQSYFLAQLTQEQLRTALFPVGDCTKAEVREIARGAGWTDLVEKPESQDFLEGAGYRALFREAPAPPGPIYDLDGRRLGEHTGIVHYTVGQRKGLGIGGAREPLYVIRIDAEANALVVGPYRALLRRRLRAADVNWILLDGPPAAPIRVQARIRQQHRPADASLWAEAESGGARMIVEFDEPQAAITPGQAVVFYQGDDVVGGGIIEDSEPG
jgi:tRNA-specific 2-thiouridylase